MDHTDRLTLLAIDDVTHGTKCLSGLDVAWTLDAKTRSLVRLAAMIAVGGAVPSYGALSDSAISAGATPAEIVEVLEAIVPEIGLPRAVAAAHRVGLALGYDTACDWDHGLES